MNITKNTTIAITGIGGFIGRKVAERAIARGLAVCGLDVSESAAAGARALGATVVVGDMSCRSAVRALMKGADVVVHTAATVAAGGDLRAFRRVNVEGTRVVAEEARNAGVRRFVHLSSVMVYGFDFPKDIAEDGPLRGDGSPYCITKIESEHVALSFDDAIDAAGRGMRVVALRPGDVYGRGSRPWVVAPIEFMKKGQFVLPRGGRGILNHVHVENLVDAIFLAMEHEGEALGESFNITDGIATTCLAFFERIAHIVGIAKIPTGPEALLVFALRVAELAHRVTHRGERLDLVDSLRFLGRPYAYSIEKARRVLGYVPRVSLDEGMADLEAWLGTGQRNALSRARVESEAASGVSL
jgi:nucleoside-diphosphate-sugar epimerase